MEENCNYGLVRVLRKNVPEWLWRIFCWKHLAVKEPFRTILTKEPDEFTKRRINGKRGELK